MDESVGKHVVQIRHDQSLHMHLSLQLDISVTWQTS